MGHDAYSMKQIIEHFLKRTKSVEFVLVIAHQVEFRPLSVPTINHLKPSLFIHPDHKGLLPKLAFLEEVTNALPPPVTTPRNAFRKFIPGTIPSKLSQEYIVDWPKVSISADDLLGILAGTLPQEEWLYEGLPTASVSGDPDKGLRTNHASFSFLRALQEGREIKSVMVVQRPNSDQDLIEFVFGEVDPAKGSFRLPS